MGLNKQLIAGVAVTCICNGWCGCHRPGWPTGEACDCRPRTEEERIAESAPEVKPRARKDAHADAVRMLRQAADLIDQAHACAIDADTDGGIQAELNRHSSARIGIAKFSELAESIAHEAETVVCDDCGLLISACDCAWSNAEVK